MTSRFVQQRMWECNTCKFCNFSHIIKCRACFEHRPFYEIKPLQYDQSDAYQLANNIILSSNILKFANAQANEKFNMISSLIHAPNISQYPLQIEVKQCSLLSKESFILITLKQQIDSCVQVVDSTDEKKEDIKSPSFKELACVKLRDTFINSVYIAINYAEIKVDEKHCLEIYLHYPHSIKYFQIMKYIFKSNDNNEWHGSNVFVINDAIVNRDLLRNMYSSYHDIFLTNRNRFLWLVQAVAKSKPYWTIVVDIYDLNTKQRLNGFVMKDSLRGVNIKDCSITLLNDYALKLRDSDSLAELSSMNPRTFTYIGYASFQVEKNDIINALKELELPVDIIAYIIECIEWGFHVDKLIDKKDVVNNMNNY
eukprot:85682_1